MVFRKPDTVNMSSRRKALFLDRDGTLIEHIPYLHDPSRVVLHAGVREALADALAAGFHLFLFTNQSGVGRGMYTMEDVEACNGRMLELLDLPPPGFTEICIAPESPDEKPAYRKPSPRFIGEMITRHDLDPARCWMIGDSEVDVRAAAKAGIHPVRVDGDTGLAEAVRETIRRESNM